MPREKEEKFVYSKSFIESICSPDHAVASHTVVKTTGHSHCMFVTCVQTSILTTHGFRHLAIHVMKNCIPVVKRAASAFGPYIRHSAARRGSRLGLMIRHLNASHSAKIG